jgi:surface protein
MYSFLRDCPAFNQDISNFNIESVTNVAYFLDGSTSWSTANYDAFLIEIANNQNVVDSLTFHCSSTYTGGGSAESARSDLISTDLWTINDLGVAA